MVSCLSYLFPTKLIYILFLVNGFFIVFGFAFALAAVVPKVLINKIDLVFCLFSYRIGLDNRWVDKNSLVLGLLDYEICFLCLLLLLLLLVPVLLFLFYDDYVSM